MWFSQYAAGIWYLLPPHVTVKPYSMSQVWLLEDVLGDFGLGRIEDLENQGFS